MFAKEIASTILWLHNVKEIIHGDLVSAFLFVLKLYSGTSPLINVSFQHPNNILIHNDTIKLADFGRSLKKGKHGDNTGVYGVIPYMDPKS